MRVRLNEIAIAKHARMINKELPRLELTDETTECLRLRIGQRKMVWCIMCTNASGAMIRVNLGRYPTLSVKDARNQALRLRVQIKDGIAATKQIAVTQPKQEIVTLRGLFDLYEQMGLNRDKAKSWPATRGKIETMLADLVDMPMPEIKLPMLQKIFDIKYGEAQQMALRMRATLRVILKWGSAPGRAYCNPDLTKLELVNVKKERERVLSNDELPIVLRMLQTNLGDGRHDYVLFLMLTCLRKTEAASLTWDNVHFDKRFAYIPDTKNGKPFEIPLSNQAIELLMRQNGRAGLVLPSETGKQLTDWGPWFREVRTKLTMPRWTLHDLRRTGATTMGNLGVADTIIERCLNHTMPQLKRTYNKSDYKPEMADAFQRLADEYERLLEQV